MAEPLSPCCNFQVVILVPYIILNEVEKSLLMDRMQIETQPVAILSPVPANM